MGHQQAQHTGFHSKQQSILGRKEKQYTVGYVEHLNRNKCSATVFERGKGTSCCQIKKGFMREILLMSWSFHGVHAQRAGGAGAGRRLLAWTCASRMPAAHLCSSSEQKLDCEKVPSVFRQQAIPWPKTGAQGTNGGQGWGCRKATCCVQGKPPIPHPGGAQRYLSRQVV